MIQFLKALVENCEIGIKRNDAGWHVIAKGPLALATLICIATLFLFR
ncbi:hypothetical protein [Ferrovibrio terrae]